MSYPIRILHLIPTLSVGGAERVMLDLARFADRGRFAPQIVAQRRLHGASLEADCERLGLPLHFLNIPRFYDPRSVAALIGYARRERIQLIHTHLLDMNVIGRAVGNILGIPVITTLHNEPGSYMEERPDRRWLERGTTRWLPSTLVAVSEHLRGLFIAEWKIPADRIWTINNAVAIERLVSIPPGASAQQDRGGPLITTIGRLSPQKGQHRFLEAARIVLQQRPDVHFQIVGQGPLEQELKTQAISFGIAGRVEFPGVSFDIPGVLARSEIFVLSSLWEGLPLTAVEAMAAARPVVLTDVGGNRDLVEDGVQGFLVPPDDAPALAAALLRLLADQERGRKMGLAGRARVRHDFAMETMMQRYGSLYEQALTRAPQPFCESEGKR